MAPGRVFNVVLTVTTREPHDARDVERAIVTACRSFHDPTDSTLTGATILLCAAQDAAGSDMTLDED